MMRRLRIVVALLCAFVAFGMWVEPPFTAAVQGSDATPAGNGRPISDPARIAATLQDLVLLSQTTDPVAGPLTATGTFDAGVPQVLSSGVHLQSAFARYSFVIPSAPNWTMGFTVGDDGQGNYNDLSIVNESGQLTWRFSIVRANRAFLVQTYPITDISGLDLTPGATIELSLVDYRGRIILAENGSDILAQSGFEVVVPGDIRAKVGWDAGDGSATSPVSMTISDFSVWAIPRDEIVWGLITDPESTPQPTPVQTPGSFIPSPSQT